jgi:hypothetical protein
MLASDFVHLRHEKVLRKISFTIFNLIFELQEWRQSRRNNRHEAMLRLRSATKPRASNLGMFCAFGDIVILSRRRRICRHGTLQVGHVMLALDCSLECAVPTDPLSKTGLGARRTSLGFVPLVRSGSQASFFLRMTKEVVKVQSSKQKKQTFSQVYD